MREQTLADSLDELLEEAPEPKEELQKAHSPLRSAWDEIVSADYWPLGVPREIYQSLRESVASILEALRRLLTPKDARIDTIRAIVVPVSADISIVHVENLQDIVAYGLKDEYTLHLAHSGKFSKAQCPKVLDAVKEEVLQAYSGASTGYLQALIDNPRWEMVESLSRYWKRQDAVRTILAGGAPSVTDAYDFEVDLLEDTFNGARAPFDLSSRMAALLATIDRKLENIPRAPKRMRALAKLLSQRGYGDDREYR
ncbi:hypothetical protein J4439_03370 [Candidatus Woesearchaeota archaeon]|nr:hypothetical protein [Candidatus Woesearchaeota archaeon]